MKEPRSINGTPKSCWSETIADLDASSRESVTEHMDFLDASIRALESRLAAYRANDTSGFKLLNELKYTNDFIVELSNQLKTAHAGIKEA
jgi:hypothetical protein